MTRQRKDVESLKEAAEILRQCWKSMAGSGKLLTDYLEKIGKGFDSWVRANGSLDSVKASLCITDIDFIVHQYRECGDKNGTRLINSMMLIEVKSHGSSMPSAQADTLNKLDQMLRRAPGQNRGSVHEVIDERGNAVQVTYYGLHVLTFSGIGPDDSEEIRWDGKKIEKTELERLLRFELHPDTLRVRDVTARRHHSNKSNQYPLLEMNN
jgi:hypothetical protein